MPLLKEKLVELKSQISRHVPVEFFSFDGKGDCYTLQPKNQGISLGYSNSRSGVFGANRLLASLKRFEKVAFGTFQAHKELRIAFPLEGDLQEPFFLKLIECGFNGVLLSESNNLDQELAKRFDLQVIIKVELETDFKHLSPFDETYLERLKALIASKKGSLLFWQSPFFEGDFRKVLREKQKLRIDLILEEIKALEKLTSFIYAPPKIAFEQISKVERALGQTNLLLFSTLDFLRGISEGPLVLFEEVHQILERENRGALIEVNPLILEGSFEECNLMVLGEALWDKMPVERSLDKWLHLRRDQICFAECKEVFYAIAALQTKLKVFEKTHSVQVEDLKIYLDALIAECRILERLIEIKQKMHPNEPLLRFLEEVSCWISSRKDFMQEALRKEQLSIPHFLRSSLN